MNVFHFHAINFRFQEENQELRAKLKLNSKPAQEQRRNQKVPRNGDQDEDQPQRNILQDIERDRVAFFQYNLETQAEQIKRLKEQINENHIINSNNTLPKKTMSTDVLTFLQESKQRCQAIEDEAMNVERKLREIRGRRSISRTSTPLQQIANPILNLKFKEPSALSSSLFLRNVLAEQIHTINSPLRSESQSQRQTHQALRSPSDFKSAQSNPNDNPNPNSSMQHIILSNNNIPPDPKPRLTRITRSNVNIQPQDSVDPGSTLKTALARGALSFEKVTSSSEAEEEPGSRSYSSSRRRISFGGEVDHDQNEEPTKLLRNEDNASERSVEASLSISGPVSHRSQGQKSADGDSADFWRL